MRLLLTGASGFIGRRLLELAPESWEVTAIWRSRSDFPDFVSSLARPRIRAERIDLANAEETAQAAALIGDDFDVVLHLAANGDPVRSTVDPLADLRETLQTALVTFTSFRARQLILFSSGAVYEGLNDVVDPSCPCRPRLPYAVTHLAAEQYARWAGDSGRFDGVAVLRFFGAYGPQEPERKIYTRLCRAFAIEGRRSFAIRGDGANLIDAMYVDDTIAAIRALIEHSPVNGTWDLSSGAAMTLRELVEKAAAVFDISSLVIDYEGSVAEHHRFRSSPTGFASAFGFTPTTPLDVGLPRLAEWLAARRQRAPSTSLRGPTQASGGVAPAARPGILPPRR